nr:MAG TPA: hypothetical protein [Caudoviricetes sp.]
MHSRAFRGHSSRYSVHKKHIIYMDRKKPPKMP